MLVRRCRARNLLYYQRIRRAALTTVTRHVDDYAPRAAYRQRRPWSGPGDVDSFTNPDAGWAPARRERTC